MNAKPGHFQTAPLAAIPVGIERTDPGSTTEEYGLCPPTRLQISGGIEGARQAASAMTEHASAGKSSTEKWARELLTAVESGCASELMDLLAEIIRVEPQVGGMERRERERMELLQGIALQMRLDLHAMLVHIYQRLEASRTYLDVVRHLAGESSAESAENPRRSQRRPRLRRLTS
ncbi:MAG: hypothetical protein KIT83_10870 [Bryobacterales bacterium]|nr:hypothetical protein [Bryobacterales bacterium]